VALERYIAEMREILFGRHAVLESLRAGRRTPYRLVILEGAVQTRVVDEILELARAHGIRVERLPGHTMAQLAGHEQHQGVLLETSEYPYVELHVILDLAQRRGEMPLVLLLDLIQDVHNLGSLIRTSEAAAVHGIVIQERRAAGITPATINTSSGAAEHMHIAQVTNLPQAMVALKEAGVWMVGLEDLSGVQWYNEADLCVPLGLVVGSESDGLRRLVRERCDWLSRIPMYGKINSLNASIAGSIALYEVLRQRGARSARS
jgi:23S rRNA (guanosine2251-2'-O)-methyltransferase